MVSSTNNLYQRILQQTAEVTGRQLGVIDSSGTLFVCSETSRIGETFPEVLEEIGYRSGKLLQSGCTFRSSNTGAGQNFIVMVTGEDAAADKAAAMLSTVIAGLRSVHDERYDRTSFIKNIVLDNILPSDIYVKSKELGFTDAAERIVLLIKFIGETEIDPYDIIKNMFPDKNTDHVVSIDEKEIALVKELRDSFNYKNVQEAADSIADTVGAEYYAKVIIGIGAPAANLKELSRAFKEAQTAIEVGKIFDNDKYIINYDSLGLGRLVYQLPTTLCESFLGEVFKYGAFESLDKESLSTIKSFFENNLNLSETARKLFVHRNTLVYRLEKIRKLTGLDLRNFDHAITFKVAIMVHKYLQAKPVKY